MNNYTRLVYSEYTKSDVLRVTVRAALTLTLTPVGRLNITEHMTGNGMPKDCTYDVDGNRSGVGNERQRQRSRAHQQRRMFTSDYTRSFGNRAHHGGTSGSPGSSRERDERGGSKRNMANLRQRRTLRNALDKAGEVALRLTLEVSAGVKAFDGPPLTPRDVKDLFLRNFRVTLSTSEAEALIVNFTKIVRRG